MRIHFAGSEDQNLIPMMKQGMFKRTFVSFFYISKSKQLHEIVKLQNRMGTSVIMDSGAHSFFSESTGTTAAPQKRKKSQSNWDPDVYWHLYLTYMRKYREYVDFFVELDIGEIVGLDKQFKWREEAAKAGLADQFIPVFHTSTETFPEFFDRIKDWPARYVALEGFPGGTPRFNHTAAIKRLYEAGIRVHGFAMTKTVAFQNMPFYSVDSTTFKSGVMFGCPVVIRKPGIFELASFGKPATYDRKLQMADQMIRNKIDPDHVYELKVLRGMGNRRAVYLDEIAIALRTIDHLEEFYTAYWKARGVDWDVRLKEAGVV